MKLDFSAVSDEALYQVWLRSLPTLGELHWSRRRFGFWLKTSPNVAEVICRQLTPMELLSAFPAVCVLRR